MFFLFLFLFLLYFLVSEALLTPCSAQNAVKCSSLQMTYIEGVHKHFL